MPIDAHWINTLCHSILLYWVSRASRGEISDVRIFVRNWNKTSAVASTAAWSAVWSNWLERRGASRGSFYLPQYEGFFAGALECERDALKEELEHFKARQRRLEETQAQVRDRIAWALDSLHNILDGKG